MYYNNYYNVCMIKITEVVQCFIIIIIVGILSGVFLNSDMYIYYAGCPYT